MSYVPHTDAERNEMLAAVGVARIEDLFADVPARLRSPNLDLPPPVSELDILREMRLLAGRNLGVDPSLSFLGAGTYQHFRPAIVDYVLSRGEFYTSYTQYQPEVSQGMLQALFEYQSMMCRLTGMDVSNASHYDGATALAEAVLLAVNVGQGRRKKIILSPAVHPQYRAVVKTYLRGTDAAAAIGDEDPATEVDSLTHLLDQDTAALVIQNPNFFGQFEAVEGFARRLRVHREAFDLPDFSGRIVAAVIAKLGDLPQAGLAHGGQINGRTDRTERRVGADIAGRFGAPDVLFAGR